MEWPYLWYHERRLARQVALMTLPEDAHWHGMFDLAEQFYRELFPQAREIVRHTE